MNDRSRQLESPSKRLRVLLFVYGVAGPVVCFLLTYVVGLSVSGPWQSGEAKDYFEVLLSPPVHVVFLPLVIYSAGCLTLWLARPERARRFSIRLGIYTGLLLSVQFLVFVVIVTGYLTFILAAFAGPISVAIVYGGTALAKRWKQFSIFHLLLLTAGVAVGVAAYQMIDLDDDYWAAPLFAVPATPALCPIVYAYASRNVCRSALNSGPTLYALALAWLGWPLAWLASWKLSVDLMLMEYQKLPTASPRCFVSAAAAHGHRRLVGPNVGPLTEIW